MFDVWLFIITYMNKANIINGKQIADQIRAKAADQIAKLKINPCLAVILVGDDPASHLYVSLKKKAAEQCSIQLCLYKFGKDADQDDILEAIAFLNNDKEVDAILVQLPLPGKFNEDKIIASINPKKDADGFHPENIKKILSSCGEIFSPLNMGIIQLLASTGENLQNKTAAIIAKSKEFTSTMARLLADFGIAACAVNPDSLDHKRAIKNADIVISAAGKPNWIHSQDIKQGAILIDVGTTRIKNKTIGDFDFESCSKKASFITPVPGGVGPMTVAMLLKNTVALALNKKRLSTFGG